MSEASRYRTALKFLATGVANMAVGLSVIYVSKLLGASDVLANICGYGVGLALSFILNRNWTFQHDGRIAAAAVRFVAVFAVAYLVNLATVLTLIDKAGINAFVAQALGVPPYTALFYVGSRYVAFPRAQRSH